MGLARRAALLLVAGAAVASWSCADADEGSGARSPVRLRVGVAQPAGGGGGTGAAQIAEALSSASLLAVERDGRAAPALARRWTESSDGLTWTFDLQPGLTFHDGTRLDAAAVARSLNESLAEPDRVPGLRDIASVEAAGPLALRVRTRLRSTLLLEALSLTPITAPPASGRPDARRPGAGPFRVLDRADGELVTLAAFDKFYRGRPSIDRVELRVFPTQRWAWAGLLRREIDFLYDVPPEALHVVRGTSQLNTFTFPRPYVFAVVFNLSHPELARRDVRIALNGAVDRQRIIEMVLSGLGRPAAGNVWFQHWAVDPSVSARPFDPAGAAALLRNAGLATTVDRSRDRRLRFTCLVPRNYVHLERMALSIQQQLAEIGVDMAVEAVDVRELIARLGQGRYDAFLVDLVAGQGFNYPYRLWHSGQASFVRSGYTAADAALDRLRHAPDDNALRAAVGELQRVLYDDPPALFLCWPLVSRAVASDFKVPTSDAAGRDVLSTLWQWEYHAE